MNNQPNLNTENNSTTQPNLNTENNSTTQPNLNTNNDNDENEIENLLKKELEKHQANKQKIKEELDNINKEIEHKKNFKDNKILKWLAILGTGIIPGLIGHSTMKNIIENKIENLNKNYKLKEDEYNQNQLNIDNINKQLNEYLISKNINKNKYKYEKQSLEKAGINNSLFLAKNGIQNSPFGINSTIKANPNYTNTKIKEGETKNEDIKKLLILISLLKMLKK